jgi:hypothetical protein
VCTLVFVVNNQEQIECTVETCCLNVLTSSYVVLDSLTQSNNSLI